MKERKLDLVDTHLAVSKLLSSTDKLLVDSLLESLIAIKKEVLALRRNPELVKESNISIHFGLCFNLHYHRITSANYKELKYEFLFSHLISLWPKHGDSINYPIKGGIEAYKQCKDKFGVTKNTVNSYTKARMELLNWSIEMIQYYKSF